jgi:hypothetical protein
MSSSEEFERATNAYRAAIDLRRLGSDQVHSRLSAMLTANTIIVAVKGDPLKDITILEHVGFVMGRGHVFKDCDHGSCPPEQMVSLHDDNLGYGDEE